MIPRFRFLNPPDQRGAVATRALRTGEAHADFAQAPDVFGALLRPNDRYPVAVPAGKRVVFDTPPIIVGNATIAAGADHYSMNSIIAVTVGVALDNARKPIAKLLVAGKTNSDPGEATQR